MTPQELKNSILQLAIQGKLVEQRKEDGTAEELYKAIQEEKQKLIAEKKIKKEKPLPPITEDEIPFDIPDNWKWVRLGDLFQHNTGKALNSSNRNGKELTYITTSNLYWDRFELDNLKSMFFTENEIDKCTVKKGDLLVCEGGDIGRASIWNFDDEVRIQNHIHRLRGYMKLHTKFYYYIFYLYKSKGLIGGKGIGIKGLSSNVLHNFIVPLPPLAEQKRIVEKIEEILPFIDKYEKAWTKLEEFNNNFPIDMQKSILQTAIQGKLVEQRKEDGTAEELYSAIQQEKQKLIAEKKIKKEKPLPPITEDEIPFDIPDNWKWVRLDDLVSKTIKRGKSPKYSSNSNTLVFAQKCNTKFGKIDMSLAQFLDDNVLIKYSKEEFMCNNDIVVNSTGNGTLGRIGIFKDSDNIGNYQIVPDSHVTVVRSMEQVEPKYLFYFLKTKQSYLEKNGGGSTNQTELKPEVIKLLLLPLPPLAEQKRIVEKIEQLLPLCERLKK